MGLPSFSVITPSFNQAPFLETAIRSVLDQDYPGLEYLVMDGGSTDGSVEILRRYQERLRFVSEKDQGQSDALNRGFATTKGEIVGWINSDDFYAPGALARVGRFFAEHPEVHWLYGRCPIVDREGHEHSRLITLYKELWARRYSYRRLLIENFISQPAVFFRRALLDKVGPLDPRYHGAMDYHLWVRMGEAARPGFIDEVLAFFRSYDENKSTLAWRRSFDEELEAARRVTAGRHPFLMALHRVNRVKLGVAYRLLELAR